MVTADRSRAIAIIPGVAMDESGQRQSFIQVLDGTDKSAEYHKFAFDSFQAKKGIHQVHISDNIFSRDSIQLHLPDLSGNVEMSHLVPWPSSWYSPGIMGPFSYVPMMQCYHGILSMDHSLSGLLEYKGRSIDFTEGRGYMEKDWGRSFPSAYFWMQSNHFSQSGISMKASVAKIPWLGSSFVGFIAGVWLGDQLIQFTTYNRSKLRKSYADGEKVLLVMESPKHLLEIHAIRAAATELASPILGFMDGRIEESMESRLQVKLTEKKTGQILLEDVGEMAGLEVAGNISEIFV